MYLLQQYNLPPVVRMRCPADGKVIVDGVALTTHQWFIHLQVQGLITRKEHPTSTPGVSCQICRIAK